jgi:hypothetical protein
VYNHGLKVLHEPRPALQGVVIPIAVDAMVADWVAGDPRKRGRLGEIAKRIALISASFNGEKIVTEECMRCAIAFAAWQLRVREVYFSSEATNPQAVVAENILAHLAEYRTPEGQPEWVSWGGLARKEHFTRKHGPGIPAMVRDQLAKEGDIEVQYHGSNDVGRRKPIGFVRLVD